MENCPSIFKNQLEVNYGFAVTGMKLYYLADTYGKFFSVEQVTLNVSPTGCCYGIYFDDTDDSLDLLISCRLHWEHSDLLSSRTETSSYYQDDFYLTSYIPILNKTMGVLVLNKFVGPFNIQ